MMSGFVMKGFSRRSIVAIDLCVKSLRKFLNSSVSVSFLAPITDS
jgi:predicted acetyltransferase